MRWHFTSRSHSKFVEKVTRLHDPSSIFPDAENDALAAPAPAPAPQQAATTITTTTPTITPTPTPILTVAAHQPRGTGKGRPLCRFFGSRNGEFFFLGGGGFVVYLRVRRG